MGASGNDGGICMRTSRMAFVCSVIGIPIARLTGSTAIEIASILAFTLACVTMYESCGRRAGDAAGGFASASLLLCAAGTQGAVSIVLLVCHWLSLLAALRVAVLRTGANVPQQECEGGPTNGIPAV